MDQTDHADTLDGTGQAPNPSSLVTARIGRYPVLRKLGEGGMGVVYAAYDDRLDRKVAIKLLRPRSREGQHGLRLLREAQGLARVSHANVVQIYEIGQHGDAVFMAMEFVAGRTLGDWLEQEPRSRGQILRAFAAAGRGLAAAHAAKLIHRDFKPDNVMMGEDGTVKVMDFGLVRATDAAEDEGEFVASSAEDELEAADRSMTMSMSQQDSLGIDLTKTGSVMGTPAYMAPEQHFGRSTDARTDQFSFCVALWEALYGERPFAGETIAALAFNVTQANVSAPTRDAKVPAWLRRVLMRGLALDPSDRFPTMDALLDALGRDPVPRRRALVGIVTVTALVVGAAVWRGARENRAEAEVRAARVEALARCDATGRAIDEVWNDAARARIEAGFLASELVFAADAWTRTHAALDDYAQTWTGARIEACVETEVEPRWTGSTATRAQDCLDQSRAALSSLLGLLAEADDARVLRAVSSVAQLPPPSDCVDPVKLAHLPLLPENPELRRRVASLREHLALIQAHDAMGEFEDGAREASSALAEAEAIGWPPMIAEANFASGELQSSLRDYTRARGAFEEAIVVATAAGDDLLALDAGVSLVYALGVGLEQPEDGLRVGKFVEVMVTRLGVGGTLADATLHTNLGGVYANQDELELARAEFERALEIYEAVLPASHPSIAIVINNLATVHAREGRVDRALASFQRVLAIREASLPANHPRFASTYENIGAAYNLLEQYDLGVAALERALVINRANLPTDHLDIASNLTNLGNAHYQREAYAAAVPMMREALEIRAAKLAPNHRLVAKSHYNLGLVLTADAKHDEAIREFAEALAIQAAALAPDARELLELRSEYGQALIHAGQTELGLAQLERVVVDLDLDLDAEPSASRASSRADARWALAVALWEAAPKRRREARALMEAAGRLYATAGQDEYVGSAQTWLQEHPAPG